MKTITKQYAIPKIPLRKRVAAYARVSSGKDAMKHSLSAQVSYYNDLIQKRPDWEFAGVYADEPTTGTKEERTEFQRLLTACRNREIDMVITKSITRFARNTVTTLEAVRELKTVDVDVYFEKENLHSMSGDGEFVLTVLSGYAQEESRSASENVKWRVRKNFKEGKPINAVIMGYKLVDGTFIIVPDEAEIVRMIFSDSLSGMGLIAIMKKLNALGIPTKHGKKWNENTINKMLRNEKYKGDLLLQKSFIENHISKKKRINKGELPMYYIEDNHEPIIDKETFQRVQEELARRADIYRPVKKQADTYPYTGKIVCGQCSSHYRRKISNAGSPYEKAAWICPTFDRMGKSACASQQIPEYILLEAVDADFKEIRVPKPNMLVIINADGSEKELLWKHKPRSDSWTDDKREQARVRQFELLERRLKDADRKED